MTTANALPRDGTERGIVEASRGDGLEFHASGHHLGSIFVGQVEIAAVQVDGGRYLGYVRAVGRRRADVQLEEPIVSVPAQYALQSLFRDKPG